MADVTITATSVLKGTVAQAADVKVVESLFTRIAENIITDGTLLSAVTLTRGQVVYRDTSVSPAVLRLAQCDGTAAESVAYGFVLGDVGAGQPVLVQTGGPITPGGTLVVGMPYALSANAGAICPVGDLVSTNKFTLIGWASTTTILQMTIINSQTALGSDIT